MADDKAPSNWKSFNDRYAGDAAFKKRVDAREKNSRATKHISKLTDTLKMVQGAPGSKKKFY